MRLVDPLADVAAQRSADPPRDLYDVESPALGQLHRWRTTALDVYNGESWSTSGTHHAGRQPARRAGTGVRAGDRQGHGHFATTPCCGRRPGDLLRSTSPVETDGERRVVRIIGDERPADTVFTLEPLTEFDPATAGAVPTVQPTDIENSFKSLARRMAGDGTVAEQVANLAAELRDDYTLNPDTPGGVQQNLIDTFLRDYQGRQRRAVRHRVRVAGPQPGCRRPDRHRIRARHRRGDVGTITTARRLGLG